MQIKRVVVVAFSPTRGSLKGALAMAEAAGAELGAPVTSVDLTDNGAACAETFGPEDLVLFAAPVYAGRLPTASLERLASAKGNGTRCIVTVSFGNRHYDDALLELADLVEGNGFVPVGAAAMVARHTFGQIQVDRPNGDDMREHAAYGHKIARALAADAVMLPQIPGTRPYKEGGGKGSFRPLTGADCIKCGLCAGICTVGAIDSADVSSIGEDCISCARCIRSCPTGAKQWGGEQYNGFIGPFEQRLAEPNVNLYVE